MENKSGDAALFAFQLDSRLVFNVPDGSLGNFPVPGNLGNNLAILQDVCVVSAFLKGKPRLCLLSDDVFAFHRPSSGNKHAQKFA
ncbi:MAG: hypothetical protein J5828_04525 [Desulfovibrionaceae bacterium]|nr:hypothetical protein [Desulfovibrionaceae bacterium]